MRKMKDSGIEWIGDIPEDWIVAPLKKYLKSIIDYRGKTPEKVPDGIFLVTARNIKNGIIDYNLSQEYVKETDYEEIMHRGKPDIGDVLFTTEAPLGEVANVDRTDIALAQRIIKFCPNDELNPYFLKYWLLNWGFQQFLNTISTGSTATGIKASKLFMFNVLITKKEEQQNIVEYLDKKCASIDSIIDKEQKLIEKLKEYKQSLITETVTKGLNPDAPMKDSGIEWIGDIPEHWEMTNVSKLYNVILGKMLCTYPLSNEDTLENYLCAANIKFEKIKTTEIKKMYFNEKEKNLYLLKYNDVVISEGGDAGTVSIYRNEFYPCYIQNAVHKVTTINSSKNINKFLYYWMYFCKNIGYVDLICNKATIMHYTKDKLSKTPILSLPFEEQKQIADYLDEKCAKIDENISKRQALIEKLNEYKKSLIYEVVTGKIEV